LSAGTIATGELLRMTAPRLTVQRVEPVVTDSLPTMDAPAAAAGSDAASSSSTTSPIPTTAAPDPEVSASAADDPTEITEIAQLARDLRDAGDAARKVTVLGSASSESITWTALELARLIAQGAKVVVVDLSAALPTISAASADPMAPGLAELMLGEASFTQIITRDRLSRVHLVSAGRPGADRALLQSPRLALAIDALLRVYDHVLLDAGTASDLPAELLTAQARAVVVPDPSMPADGRTLMCDQLKAVGFSDVRMLSAPSRPSDVADPGQRVAAA
jgi:Mrp family chromosome partitioning ATPase